MNYRRGSEWRIWDLQVQTILDDGYKSLGKYAGNLKKVDIPQWDEYVAKVGGEENAIAFDSKAYFKDEKIDKKERCRNYQPVTAQYSAFICLKGMITMKLQTFWALLHLLPARNIKGRRKNYYRF